MTIPRGDYRDPASREHFVYRIYDSAGRLLYVGCSMRPEKRWAEHRADRKSWTSRAQRFRMSGPYNYDTARRLEREALRDEYPLHAMTPQKLSAKSRRNRWINRQVAAALKPDHSMADFLAAHQIAKRRASRIDWLAIAEEAIRAKA